MKKAYIITIIILVFGIGGWVVVANKSAGTYVSSGNSASQETIRPTGTTTDTAPATSGEKTFTMADVAAHSTGKSCYTAIGGTVYDVTSWILNHPGGPEAILSLCGKDGSQAFSNQHGGQRRPASELATFKIGVLAQ